VIVTPRWPSSESIVPVGGPDQLPSGKHGLSRRYVSSNQRERLLHGVALALTETTYSSITVADVTRAARVSRRTFYEHFADKDECFLAAYDDALARVLSEVKSARDRHADWPDQVRATVTAFVELVISDPALGRLCLLESTAIGDRAIERRERAVESFVTGILDGGPGHAVGGVDVAPLTAELVIGGITQVVNARLLQGRAESLREDIPAMIYCALVPFCGPELASAKAGESDAAAIPA
jgi:AcrR family transcriptional regulator